MSKRWNMTNDEAVEWLLSLKDLDICGEYRKTAIDKAITALKSTKKKEQETVEELERPKGKWIEYKVDIAPHPLHCSLCGFSNHHISNRYMREFRRCPNCGADMRGGEDGNSN